MQYNLKTTLENRLLQNKSKGPKIDKVHWEMQQQENWEQELLVKFPSLKRYQKEDFMKRKRYEI